MKIILVAIGSAGDVHPFLAIGVAAARRGHRVTICTSPAFEGLVQACGLGFAGLGSQEEYAQAINDPRLWNPRTSFAALWDIVSCALQPLYDILKQHATDDCVVLGSLWAFSARALQIERRLSYLSAQVSPSTLLSAVAPPEHPRFAFLRWLPLPARRALMRWAERRFVDQRMAPKLSGFLAGLGLPPARRVLSSWVHSPEGVLALFPDWFAPAQSDWPANLHYTGFPSFEGPPGHPNALDPALAAFLAEGPPPVVVTAGSTLLHGTHFFATAQRTLTMLGLRGVFLGGSGAALLPMQGHVLHRSHAPLAPLLARSAGIIHHGGVGTIAFALRAGVPQLVLPFAHDQFDNARRVVELGVGTRLANAARAPAWPAALQNLLGSTSIRSACLHWQSRALADSGPIACEKAVDLIEACARSRALLASKSIAPIISLGNDGRPALVAPCAVPEGS